MTRHELGATALAAALVGCGGPSPVAVEPLRDSPPPMAAHVSSAAERRLEGRWVVTGFRPKNPIPEEARPIVARLFGAMQLRFAAQRLVVSVGETSEERAFSISDEQGESFRLRVPGGMFDGAWARFRDDGTLELVDDGNPWPGVSTLRPLDRD